MEEVEHEFLDCPLDLAVTTCGEPGLLMASAVVLAVVVYRMEAADLRTVDVEVGRRVALVVGTLRGRGRGRAACCQVADQEGAEVLRESVIKTIR